MSDQTPLTKEQELAGEEAFERRFFGGDEAENHAREVAYREGASDREANADMSVNPEVPGIAPATQRQLRYLQAVAREAGMDAVALDERSMQEFGVQASALSRRDASTLIDLIQIRNLTPDEP